MKRMTARKRRWLTFLLQGMTTTPPVGPGPSQGTERDGKAYGKTTGWEGYCTTRKNKEKAGRARAGGEGSCC